IFTVEVAKELGLPESEIEALRAAALMHDIGKLAIPEHIINKPGRLTPEEFEKMKIHTLVGAEILERVAFPYPVAPIVRAHHERWDGAGYPDGLKGEQIPSGARVLAAVDCLDALASHRHVARCRYGKSRLLVGLGLRTQDCRGFETPLPGTGEAGAVGFDDGRGVAFPNRRWRRGKHGTGRRIRAVAADSAPGERRGFSFLDRFGPPG